MVLIFSIWLLWMLRDEVRSSPRYEIAFPTECKVFVVVNDSTMPFGSSGRCDVRRITVADEM